MFFNPKRGLVFDAEKGKAGDPAGNPEGGDPQGDPDTKGKDGGTQGDEKRFTQADIDRIVADRLDREKRKAESEAQKAKEKAESEALAENQKWQELAQKHEAKIKDLESKLAEFEAAKETLEKYKGALEAHLQTQRADLPGHITALLDKLDPVDQLEYIAKNAGELKKKTTKVPETPTPAGDGELSEATKADALAATNRFYRNMFQ